MNLLQEILQHLRDLRNVDLKSRMLVMHLLQIQRSKYIYTCGIIRSFLKLHDAESWCQLLRPQQAEKLQRRYGFPVTPERVPSSSENLRGHPAPHPSWWATIQCGKSSVLESSAGSASLAQGICTRVPLVMRLRTTSPPRPSLQLGTARASWWPPRVPMVADRALPRRRSPRLRQQSPTRPSRWCWEEGRPTDPGPGTLTPARAASEDIYDQCPNIIKQYIAPPGEHHPQRAVGDVDSPRAESIPWSPAGGPHGDRTSPSSPKADKAPEGLLERSPWTTSTSARYVACATASATRPTTRPREGRSCYPAVKSTGPVVLPLLAPFSAFRIIMRNRHPRHRQADQRRLSRAQERRCRDLKTLSTRGGLLSARRVAARCPGLMGQGKGRSAQQRRSHRDGAGGRLHFEPEKTGPDQWMEWTSHGVHEARQVPPAERSKGFVGGLMLSHLRVHADLASVKRLVEKDLEEELATRFWATRCRGGRDACPCPARAKRERLKKRMSAPEVVANQ
ncbi:hypothetical protein PR202_ga26316 [Eleusine coracana subsp. coracana]|uniref:Uncharacterized protein n=1 Tax=Eleusine coracana subsp. coracana TaxID=191504 RepID=A0AAV5DD50_ELECO|nr:hypothetical protein PR202_ga26316 [Eleusine coracana subsp. coracana]